jgi:hypothetical protein
LLLLLAFATVEFYDDVRLRFPSSKIEAALSTIGIPPYTKDLGCQLDFSCDFSFDSRIPQRLRILLSARQMVVTPAFMAKAAP